MSDHPDPQVGNRDKNVGWYLSAAPELSDATRDVLESYSHIPPDQVIPHVLKVRDTAWEIYPYPCIGQYRFLDLSIGTHELYPEILSRMKSGNETYLDLGCCFGQDIRRLVKDGVASENCYGSDLRLDFMMLGYNLFLDKDSLKTKFIEADIFDAESNLKTLDGRVDILHAAAFFHLFDYEDQKKIGRRVVGLLKPRKGSLLVGRQVGNVKGGQFDHRTNPKQKMFRHDVETWKQMWKEIGDETGTMWEADAELHIWHGVIPSGVQQQWQPDGVRQIRFSVRRV